MTPSPPLVALVLVGEARDLGTPVMIDHLGPDGRAAQLIGRGQDGVTVDDHDRGQLDRYLGLSDELDLELLAFFDSVLLTTGVNDCVHDVWDLWDETM
jgi:hypothetical protein